MRAPNCVVSKEFSIIKSNCKNCICFTTFDRSSPKHKAMDGVRLMRPHIKRFEEYFCIK